MDFGTVLNACALGVIVAVAVVVVLLKYYMPSYLAEKGKNLATREDIAAITHEVEQVRLEYSKLVEELKARHQLRMAALDRRLQAHQEAFTHWRRLMASSEETGAAIFACQSWWEENCLYLEPKVRQAFVEAYINEGLRNEFVRNRADSQYIKEAWEKVIAFPNVLFEAVQLPALSEIEAKSLEVSITAPHRNGG